MYSTSARAKAYDSLVDYNQWHPKAAISAMIPESVMSPEVNLEPACPLLKMKLLTPSKRT